MGEFAASSLKNTNNTESHGNTHACVSGNLDQLQPA
jgi:hypothetical protein